MDNIRFWANRIGKREWTICAVIIIGLFAINVLQNVQRYSENERAQEAHRTLVQYVAHIGITEGTDALKACDTLTAPGAANGCALSVAVFLQCANGITGRSEQSEMFNGYDDCRNDLKAQICTDVQAPVCTNPYVKLLEDKK